MGKRKGKSVSAVQSDEAETLLQENPNTTKFEDDNSDSDSDNKAGEPALSIVSPAVASSDTSSSKADGSEPQTGVTLPAEQTYTAASVNDPLQSYQGETASNYPAAPENVGFTELAKESSDKSLEIDTDIEQDEAGPSSSTRQWGNNAQTYQEGAGTGLNASLLANPGDVVIELNTTDLTPVPVRTKNEKIANYIQHIGMQGIFATIMALAADPLKDGWGNLLYDQRAAGPLFAAFAGLITVGSFTEGAYKKRLQLALQTAAADIFNNPQSAILNAEQRQDVLQAVAQGLDIDEDNEKYHYGTPEQRIRYRFLASLEKQASFSYTTNVIESIVAHLTIDYLVAQNLFTDNPDTDLRFAFLGALALNWIRQIGLTIMELQLPRIERGQIWNWSRAISLVLPPALITATWGVLTGTGISNEEKGSDVEFSDLFYNGFYHGMFALIGLVMIFTTFMFVREIRPAVRRDNFTDLSNNSSATAERTGILSGLRNRFRRSDSVSSVASAESTGSATIAETMPVGSVRLGGYGAAPGSVNNNPQNSARNNRVSQFFANAGTVARSLKDRFAAARLNKGYEALSGEATGSEADTLQSTTTNTGELTRTRSSSAGPLSAEHGGWSGTAVTNQAASNIQGGDEIDSIHSTEREVIKLKECTIL